MPKMGFSKCRILKKVICEFRKWGYGFLMGRPACYEDNSVKFSLPLVDERFVYFEISIEFSKYF